MQKKNMVKVKIINNIIKEVFSVKDKDFKVANYDLIFKKVIQPDDVLRF